MILRDIFTDIKEIFDFEYEKNPNGSYRVNTVIRKLVYPELYLCETYSDNDICYYLANYDYSYQSIPNIRNSFSELMNHTTMHNRFPIVYFSEQIDINKMYEYYRMLINDRVSRDTSKKNLLSDFFNKIFTDDPSLNAQLKLICHFEYEFLTWIIIFSMFNNELAEKKFKEYAETHSYDMSNLSLSESSDRHRLSSYLYKEKKRLNKITSLTYIFSGLQIFIVIIPYIMFENNSLFSGIKGSIFCVTMLIFSVLLLLLRIYQSKCEIRSADLQTYHDYMDELPEIMPISYDDNGLKSLSIKPYNNSGDCNTSRETLRKSLKFVIYIILVMAVFLSFVIRSFPILIALVMFVVIVVMYADKRFHDSLVRTVYDTKTSKKGEDINQWKGIAKIYRWEYERTGFDPKDRYYQNTMHTHSSSCYKHIFLIAHERLRYNLYVYTITLLYLSLLLLLVVSLNIFLGDAVTYYLKFNSVTSLNILITFYLLGIGIYSITALIVSRTNYGNLSLLAFASNHAEDNPSWAEKTFLSLYARGIIRNTDWMRGIFTYNVSLFEQDCTIEDIFPETDRMLFYHRQFVFKNNAKITLWMVYGILISVFVWHMGLYNLILPISALCIAVYIYLCKSGLDKIHKKKIIRYINSLSD